MNNLVIINLNTYSLPYMYLDTDYGCSTEFSFVELVSIDVV